MPEAIMESAYCAKHIIIPPSFPHILKMFAKAAIRTQPYDLLTWAASYFKALADGTVPPQKERLEYPLVRSEGGLSFQYLKLLVKQFDTPNEIERIKMTRRWIGICLSEVELKQIYCTARIYRVDAFQLYKFIAVAAGFLCNSLTQTMVMLCEIYTDEPDGANATIPAPFFMEMYSFLANMDASKEITYYDGLTSEEYEAKRPQESIILEGVELGPIERWVPKMRGWRTESAILKMNVILGEILPLEGGRISENIAIPIRPPREKFTDPNHPQFPYIPSEELRCRFSEDDVEEKGEHTSDQSGTGTSRGTPRSGETEEQSPKEGGADDQSSPTREGDENSAEENDQPEGQENGEGEEDKPSDEDEPPGDEDEDGGEEDGKDAGEESKEESQQGSNVSVRVYSEEGNKISDGEEEGEDISVKDREAIIEQLEINKEKRVNEFMETIESLDDLVEQTQKLKSEAEKMGSKGEIVVCSSKIIPPPESKISKSEISKESISEETTSSKIPDEHIPDVIVVPAKPGIGPVVEPQMFEEVKKFIEEASSYQAGMIMPRDFLHCLCPPLEKKVSDD